jgi:predicted glycogen debranching enzyme
MDMMNELNNGIPIEFDSSMVSNEWLETNGLGGFASSTVSGIHTRRYHGWLLMAGSQPGDRYLALSKFEDWLEVGGVTYPLSANQYPGTIHPNGHKLQWQFRRYPFPVSVFKLDNVFVEREIFMVNGNPGVFVRYSLYGKGADHECVLTVRPLLNNRFYHHLAREGSWNVSQHSFDSGLVVSPHYAQRDLAILCDSGKYREDAYWYKSMIYSEEKRRGLDNVEDHFSPGYFRVPLHKEVYFWVGPSLGKKPQLLLEYLRENSTRIRNFEYMRRVGIIKTTQSPLKAALKLAADQFVVRSGDSCSIVAGYHWFGEWGRDTFISLPGLLIYTRRYEDAKSVFIRFLDKAHKGLVPNVIGGGGDAQYNSVDGSLWLARALREYEKVTGDREFIASVLARIKNMALAMLSGSQFGVKASSSGLLQAGTSSTQITWMDACVNGVPITPRAGFPVEVNGLWISFLFNLTRWLRRSGDSDYLQFRKLALSARKAFWEAFGWPGVGLKDVVGEGTTSYDIRPNQVIAASIPELRLPTKCLKEVIHTTFTHLLTPRGLRTLSPYSPNYRGRYMGGPSQRDSAYHQGTAWPFLLGPFSDLLSLCERNDLIELCWDTVLDIWKNPCLGSIYEVASGDPPFEPGGSVSQAWSVAEALRILDYLDKQREWKEGLLDEASYSNVGMGISARSRRRVRASRVPPLKESHKLWRRCYGLNEGGE